MTTLYRVRVSMGSHAYDPVSSLFRRTRHLMSNQKVESRKALRQAMALLVLSPHRSLVHISRHQLESSYLMDGRRGVWTGGHARFRCLTRARVMKANLWRLTQSPHLPEDSVCADNTWVTKTVSVSKKRKRKMMDGTVWRWRWNCSNCRESGMGCDIHELLGKTDLCTLYRIFTISFLVLCSMFLVSQFSCFSFIYKKKREKK